ncbi:MAG: ATP-binding protein [Phycisphaerales bacterium]
MSTLNATQATEARAAELFRHDYERVVGRVDRLFAGLLIFQWLATVASVYWISPYTWIGATPYIHLHVWAAILMGGAISSLPVLLAFVRPGTVLTRHCVAVAQMLTSALLIHVMGGRIETHFHVFGSLAFLSFYRDWRVLTTATAVVAVDHFVRGWFWPLSAYGVAGGAEWRWLEHAGWVAFEDTFLLIACVQGQREMWEIARRQAEIEQKNTDLVEAAERANAGALAKSQFLATMSHEIRTPLNGVIGMIDLITVGKLGPKQRHFASMARTSAKNLSVILNDILDFSKIEAGKLEIVPTDFDVQSTVNDVLALMDPLAKKKGLELRSSIAPDVPRYARADADRIRQILMNLVGNAIKFTASGGVRVELEISGGDKERPTLRFSVTDTGIGISRDRFDRLFKAFSQTDSSTTRTYGGTGLGLVISRQLAYLLGGTIGVESEEKKGSTFWLALPVDDRTAAMPPAPIANDEDAVAVPVESEFEGLRLLLAEDNEINRIMATEMLRSVGFTCEHAHSGACAVDLAQQTRVPFDLVLMDCQMPEMDGFDATRAIRMIEAEGRPLGRSGTRLPIIALTANAMKGDKERCLDAGMDAYATKPIEQAALFDTIRAVLASRKQRSAA